MTVSSGLLAASSTVAIERLIGVSSEALSAVLEDWATRSKEPVKIVVVSDERLAEKTAADLAFFNRRAREDRSRMSIHQLPAIEPYVEDLAAQFDAGSEQIAGLNEIRSAKESASVVIVATIEALAQSAPDPKALAALQIELKVGTEYGFDRLLEDLERLDYDHEGLCESPGQFAKRGGLIDVYPITADKHRVDFFGDEIESIKTLIGKPTIGRERPLIALTLHMDIEKAKNGILDYLETSVAWALVEPESLVKIWTATVRGADRIEEDSGTVFALRDQSRRYMDYIFRSRPGNRCGFRNLDDLRNRVSHFYRSYPDESKLADERLADEQAARIRTWKLQEWNQGQRSLLYSNDDERALRRCQETKSLGKLKRLLAWRFERGFGSTFAKIWGA